MVPVSSNGQAGYAFERNLGIAAVLRWPNVPVVARDRQPSTAQQKLKRRSCSGPSRQGRPRGLRG